MTYANFITNIAQWMNRTRHEIDTVIAEQIIESQYELEKIAPLWFLVDEYTAPIALGAISTKVPGDIIQVLDAEIYDSDGYKYPVAAKNLPQLRDEYPIINGSSAIIGRPQILVPIGHVLEFGPQSDAIYTLRIRAWHHLDPLNTTTNTQNEWTRNYLAALRFKVLVDLEAYIKDDTRMATWKTRCDEWEAKLKAECANAQIVGTMEIITDTEDLYS